MRAAESGMSVRDWVSGVLREAVNGVRALERSSVYREPESSGADASERQYLSVDGVGEVLQPEAVGESRDIPLVKASQLTTWDRSRLVYKQGVGWIRADESRCPKCEAGLHEAGQRITCQGCGSVYRRSKEGD